MKQGNRHKKHNKSLYNFEVRAAFNLSPILLRCSSVRLYFFFGFGFLFFPFTRALSIAAACEMFASLKSRVASESPACNGRNKSECSCNNLFTVRIPGMYAASVSSLNLYIFAPGLIRQGIYENSAACPVLVSHSNITRNCPRYFNIDRHHLRLNIYYPRPPSNTGKGGYPPPFRFQLRQGLFLSFRNLTVAFRLPVVPC